MSVVSPHRRGARLQLSRGAGAKLPATGRSVAYPTPWRNPYRPAERSQEANAAAVEQFRRYLCTHPDLVAAGPAGAHGVGPCVLVPARASLHFAKGRSAVTSGRIQRRRGRGWRKPNGAVIVDRTSRWGNPFSVQDAIANGLAADADEARTVVRNRFRCWLLGEVDGDPDVFVVGRHRLDRRWMRRHLLELRGRMLCCPCPEGADCHGDVLGELAALVPVEGVT